MTRYTVIFIFLLLSFAFPGKTQTPAEKMIQERGEVYIIFPTPSHPLLYRLSRELSIDVVHKDSVIANVNDKEYHAFLEENIPYRLYFYPRPKETGKVKSVKALQNWTSYPTYEQYDSIMQHFAVEHPDICRIDTLGQTVQGRLLLTVKISDHVNQEENEPQFFYTSTMHGDETGGYILMLHLIDYLLSHYDSDDRVHMMIDSMEIWINPLANPDGTYHGGNQTVLYATRRNAQGIDLNRNFPNPLDGPHPDGSDYAPETVAMMQFMQSHHFILSCNFHAGEEVVNYPWDSWDSSEKVHADDTWFRYISREYADTVHAYSKAGYMTFAGNGVTNGGDWYVITGGRQDYVTFYLHGREITIELDDTKITSEEELDTLWKYNTHSLLNYMQETMWGIAGTVTDSLTGHPLCAKIEIPGHDKDSSWIKSDSVHGSYHRLLIGGSYDLQASAPGYQTKIISGITVINHQLTHTDIKLVPVSSHKASPGSPTWNIYPNPAIAGSDFTLKWPVEESAILSFVSLDGRCFFKERLELQQGNNKISLPQGLMGTFFIKIQGLHTKSVTGKLVILSE